MKLQLADGQIKSVQPPDPESKEKRQRDKWTQAREQGIFI